MTTSGQPSTEWIAACHEAAHAVGACLLGLPLVSVYIETDGSGDGGFDTVTLGEIRKRGLWPRCAVVAELGRAVERRLFDVENPGAWEDDQARIRRAAKECFPGEGQQARRRQFKRALPRQAQEAMRTPGFLQAVEAVAVELVRAKRLDGGRVEAIARQFLPARNREPNRPEAGHSS